MGYKSEKAKREIRDHNKDYLGLTEFEIILHEAIMGMKDNNIFPQDLEEATTKILRQYAEKMNFEVNTALAEAVAEWLKSKLR